MLESLDPLPHPESFFENAGRLHDATVIELMITRTKLELRVDDLFKALVSEPEYPGPTPGIVIFHRPGQVTIHALTIEEKLVVFDARVTADSPHGTLQLTVEFAPGGLLTATCKAVGVQKTGAR